jgi:hypothetical protein
MARIFTELSIVSKQIRIDSQFAKFGGEMGGSIFVFPPLSGFVVSNLMRGSLNQPLAAHQPGNRLLSNTCVH